MNTRITILALSIGVGAVAAGCAALAPTPDYSAAFEQMMKSSFRDQGIVKVDRLKQDEADAACSQTLGAPMPEAKAKAIEAAELKTLKLPSDGRFLGDWREGEKLAQNGRGMTWTDSSSATSANGGNCYNCHQLSKAELSYGTIGPSLYRYGRNRGVTDIASPAAQPMIEYTWIRVYNAKAFSACSTMPRFGHEGMLDTAQIADLMSLLLDPQSPVNQ